MSRLQEFRRQSKLMGSAFEFVILAPQDLGDELIDSCIAEVIRIERLITEFSDDSQTAELNRFSGIRPVKVAREVYDLIVRCKHISRLTQGAFDITSSILKGLYRFGKTTEELPTLSARETLLKKTGWEKIELKEDCHVFLKEEGMKIGFGAIGKGYAADMVKKMLCSKGIKHGVISASGDLTAWGSPMSSRRWRIGIANPDNPAESLLEIPLMDMSMATSGDYEKYFVFNGERYSHSIDPRTAIPVKGLRSVSVISPSAELSDAFATSLTIMGPEAGIHLVEQLPGLHALFILENGRIIPSSHLILDPHEIQLA